MRSAFGRFLLVVTAASPLVGTVPGSPARAQAPAPAARAQNGRPMPPPVDPEAGFLQAIRNGTRTTTGKPGPRYWTQFATYRLTAKLLLEQKRVEGTALINYKNNSPDTLTNLHIDLTQNFHRADAMRQEGAEITQGMELGRVLVDNQELRTGGEGPRYQVYGTRLLI